MASTTSFSVFLLAVIILSLSSSSADQALISQICKTGDSDSDADTCIRWLTSNPNTMACPDKPCLVDATMTVAINQAVAASDKAKQLLTSNPKPSDVGPLHACVINYKLARLMFTETSVAVKAGVYGEAAKAITVGTGFAYECEMGFTEQPGPLHDVVKPLIETINVGFVIVGSFFNGTGEIGGIAGLPRRLGK